MVTAYEAIFLIDATLAEDQVKAIVDKYSGVITRSGGEVDDVDIWDPRRTAYEVKGRREARYIVFNFHSEPAAKDELDRIFGISDDVLRSMILRQDPRADRFPSRARAADQERREREAAARAAVEPQVVTELPATEAPVAEEAAETAAEVEAAPEAPAAETEAPTTATEPVVEEAAEATSEA